MDKTTQDDRRQHERIPIDLLVRFRFDTFASFVDQHAMNISAGGMFIRTDQPPAIGAITFLQFSLEDGLQLIEGIGKVVRVVAPGGNEASGFGVEFMELDAASRSLIQGICERRAQSA